MTGALIDTNVVSELTRPQPDAHVVTYLSGLVEGWLSAITLHELAYGIRRHPSGARRNLLSARVAELSASYGDRVLSVDQAVAEHAARYRVAAERAGRVLHLADALIAGTAAAHGLVLATRNVSDFDWSDVAVVNPWLPQIDE